MTPDVQKPKFEHKLENFHLYISCLVNIFQSTKEEEEFIYIPDHEKARLVDALKDLQKP